MSQPVVEVLRTLQRIPVPHEIIAPINSPYACYANSNYSAAEWELPSIRKIICQHNDQIKDLDTIIEKAETIAKEYREMREQVASSVKTHEGFISCIRCLPVEILKEIFIRCLPTTMLIKPAARTAPLLLTQLCRDWRAVALHTPTLWCSLYIERLKKPELPFYHDWLKNAKGLPLSLRVPLYERDVVSEFFHPHASQLTSLSAFFGDVNDGLDVLLKGVPVLERLSLSGALETLKQFQTISIVQPQPHLHTLFVNTPTLGNDVLSRLNLGWTNLTHLAILMGYRAKDRIFFTLLRMCPNLQHFTFSWNILDSVHANPVSFTHSKLRSLEIIQWFSGEPISDSVLLPNLCSFHIHNTPKTPFTYEPLLLERQPQLVFDLVIEAYVDFATGCYTVLNPGWTDLTHLRVDIQGFQEVFLRILRLCPNLEDIVVSSVRVDQDDDDFDNPIVYPSLRSLTIRNPKGFWERLLGMMTLPGLRYLYLSLSEDRGWPQEEFTEFVSRSQCPLETLKFNGVDVSIGEREELALLVPTLRHVELSDIVDIEEEEGSGSKSIHPWIGYVDDPCDILRPLFFPPNLDL